jgi:hypothetical protein
LSILFSNKLKLHFKIRCFKKEQAGFYKRQDAAYQPIEEMKIPEKTVKAWLRVIALQKEASVYCLGVGRLLEEWPLRAKEDKIKLFNELRDFVQQNEPLAIFVFGSGVTGFLKETNPEEVGWS